jgi:hypothetical protein
MLAARGVWGAHRETALMRDATHCGASPRAISGVPPEDRVRRDAEHHTRDAYAPQTYRNASSILRGNRETRNAHQTQRIVSFLGPCAPSTRIRSISPVRLGPVMNEMKLG